MLDRAKIETTSYNPLDELVSKTLQIFKRNDSYDYISKNKSNIKIINIKNSFINNIRLINDYKKPKITIDFNYARYGKENNVIPLTCQKIKKEVDDYIVNIFSQITGVKDIRGSIYYTYLELTKQIKVSDIDSFTNTLDFIETAIANNIKNKNEKKFSERKKTGEIFNSGHSMITGIGVKDTWYIKAEKYIRFETKLNCKSAVKKYFNTNNIDILTIKTIKKSFCDKKNEVIKPALVEWLQALIYRVKKEFTTVDHVKLENTVTNCERLGILDSKIIEKAIYDTSDVKERQTIERKKIAKKRLENSQKYGKIRDNFENLGRLALICKEVFGFNFDVKIGFKLGVRINGEILEEICIDEFKKIFKLGKIALNFIGITEEKIEGILIDNIFNSNNKIYSSGGDARCRGY